MSEIVMYSKQTCPYCVMAKRLLEQKGQAWNEIDVDMEPERRDEMIERTGRRTVPQIFISDEHVGGFDELAALERAGQLDALLAR
jgi:glutaredoxin 3